MKRKFRKAGRRQFRFDCDKAQCVIFGAADSTWWGWGVWGSHYGKEGIESSLKRARERANQALDGLLLAEKSAEGVA